MGQHVESIVVHGISPSGNAETREIKQSGVINISPFGRVLSIVPSNSTVVKDD